MGNLRMTAYDHVHGAQIHGVFGRDVRASCRDERLDSCLVMQEDGETEPEGEWDEES